MSTSNNGVSASASVGNNGSLASVGASVGTNGVGANASVGRGSVADLGVSLGGNGLGLSGSVLGIGINRGTPTTGGPNPGPSNPTATGPTSAGRSPAAPSGASGINGGRLGVALAGLSPREVMRMKQRCRDIMAQPSGYDHGLVDLCRALGQVASR